MRLAKENNQQMAPNYFSEGGVDGGYPGGFPGGYPGGRRGRGDF